MLIRAQDKYSVVNSEKVDCFMIVNNGNYIDRCWCIEAIIQGQKLLLGRFDTEELVKKTFDKMLSNLVNGEELFEF